jgi:two-component system response regulator
MSAEEVLAALRKVRAYQTVPVIIFSSGEEASGQQRSLQLRAKVFVEKPLDLQEFFAAVQAIVKTWGLTASTDTAD